MERAVSHLLPERLREYAPDIEDVLDAAAEWQAGRLDLNTLLHLGTIPYQGRPSPRYSRFVAVATTSPSDPRRAALLAAIERVASTQGTFTHQGFFQAFELHQHDRAAEVVRLSRAPWEQAA